MAENTTKMVKLTVKTPKEKKEIELESNASIEKVFIRFHSVGPSKSAVSAVLLMSKIPDIFDRSGLKIDHSH